MVRDKFLFVINPISGGLDKSNYTHKLEHIFSQNRKTFKVFETKGEDADAENVRQIINEYEPDVVVAVGGDGTCNLVAAIIVDMKVLFGIVPLGSANGLAKELNIFENPDLATKLLFDGVEKPIDALLINEEHLCLHLSDIGLNAKVVKRFEEEKLRGMFGYFKQLVRELIYTTPKKFRFDLNGNQFRKKANMVVIANASKYGTGAIMNPVGKIDDGKFEICIVKPFPKLAILSLTYHLFKGTIKTSPYVQIISCRKITIFNPQKEVLQIDGEIKGNPAKVNVTILPKAFTLIVAEPT